MNAKSRLQFFKIRFYTGFEQDIQSLYRSHESHVSTAIVDTQYGQSLKEESCACDVANSSRFHVTNLEKNPKSNIFTNKFILWTSMRMCVWQRLQSTSDCTMGPENVLLTETFKMPFVSVRARRKSALDYSSAPTSHMPQTPSPVSRSDEHRVFWVVSKNTWRKQSM